MGWGTRGRGRCGAALLNHGVSCRRSPKQLLNDLVPALQLLLELLRADEVFLVAGAPGHDARKLRRDLDIGMSREILGLRHDLLAFAAQYEIGEQHGGVRMLGPLA